METYSTCSSKTNQSCFNNFNKTILACKRFTILAFKTLAKPFKLLIYKICEIYRNFVGKMLRICVFQVGLYDKSFIAKILIQIYSSQRFDKKRIGESIDILERIGGQRKIVKTQDGMPIERMLIKSDQVKKAIEENGGVWKTIEVTRNGQKKYLDIIEKESKSPNRKKWDSFEKEVIARMGWEQAVVLDDKGVPRQVYVTNTQDTKPSPEKDEKGCFLRCHSPAISYSFERKYIAMHLGLKKDVCIFDYRGTNNSKGIPSEGGYYLDGEAVYQDLVQEEKYKPTSIWATGFCGGSGTAAFLKAKHHEEGINFVAENSFSSILKMIDHQIWPAKLLGRLGLEFMKSEQESVTSLVEQDFYNNVGKLKQLKTMQDSTTIIIRTDTDKKVPPNSGEKLHQAAGKTSHSYLLTRRGKKGRDGHDDQPLYDPKVWEQYANIIRNKSLYC